MSVFSKGFKPFKNRVSKRDLVGMKVFIFWNLHLGGWSIESRCGEFKGLIIGHIDKISLVDVEFKVSQAGRRRVIKEKKKNVHAGLVGVIDTVDHIVIDGEYKSAYYNPYKVESFVNGDVPLFNANRAIMLEKSVIYKD